MSASESPVSEWIMLSYHKDRNFICIKGMEYTCVSCIPVCLTTYQVQCEKESTLKVNIVVISTSIFSNKRLSWSETLNMKIKQQVTKYWGKSLFSTIFSISLISGDTYSFVKCCCLIYFRPQFFKSDMSRYGYLELFQRVPLTSW